MLELAMVGIEWLRDCVLQMAQNEQQDEKTIFDKKM